VPPLQSKPSGRPVATMTLGSGRSATSFDVLAWQVVGKGAGTGSAARTRVSDLQIMKRTDKASPSLFKACATGKHIPTATLTVRKAGSKTPYLTITLKNVLVSSYQLGGSGGGKATESLSLNFTKIEYKYSAR
jgi:type VI secretion system secreted protein Hcp